MKINNWGRNQSVESTIVAEDFLLHQNQKVCPRGNGRSYGDASLYPLILSSLRNKDVLRIEDGILTVSAGYLLCDVFNFCSTHLFLFPVIPGTSQVTIGGMIAADVHGKNHKVNGTIGNWVKSISLKNEHGELIFCSNENHPDLFYATIGGMGLTGFIDSVEIQLEPLKASHLLNISKKYTSLNDGLLALEKSTSDYQTMWCDLLNEQSYLVLQNTWQTTDKNEFSILKKGKLRIPKIPFRLVRTSLMKVYNKRYQRKQLQKNGSLLDPQEVFFPLDAIEHWNRLYGPKGFYQYQFILPMEVAKNGIEEIFEQIRASKYQAFLAVIKVHGAMRSPGILSFPIEGYSVALDFSNTNGIVPFLNQLDTIVQKYGGRIYLAKDSVLQVENFEAMYPSHLEFKHVLQTNAITKYHSMLSERLNLTQ